MDNRSPLFTDSERDVVYTHLCQTMTTLGESEAPHFLARLALLTLESLGSESRCITLIDQAAKTKDTVESVDAKA